MKSAAAVLCLHFAVLIYVCSAKTNARQDAFQKLRMESEAAVQEVADAFRQAMTRAARCQVSQECAQGPCLRHACSGGVFGNDFKCASNLEVIDKDHIELCSKSEDPDALLANKEEPFLLSPNDSENVTTSGDGSSIVVRNLELRRDVCVAKTLKNTLRDAHKENNLNEWLYFGTQSGVMLSYPGKARARDGNTFATCRDFDPTIRPWFVNAASGPKDVVFLLDTSGSKGVLYEALIKTIDSLDNRDFVAVVAFNKIGADNIISEANGLQRATSSAKTKLRAALDDVRFSTTREPNTKGAFGTAFDILDTSTESSQCSKLIVLLSSEEDGCFSTCTRVDAECKCVQELRDYIASRQKERPNTRASLVAFTEVRSTSSERLARTIVCDQGNNGIWNRVSKGDNPESAMSAYSELVAASLFEDKPKAFASELYEDASSLGEMFTLAEPVYAEKRFVGVVGADITLKKVTDAVGDEDLARKQIEKLSRESRSCARFNTPESCVLQKLRNRPSSAKCADIFPKADCYRGGNILYKPMLEAKSFDEARAACYALGNATLAKPDTPGKNQLLSGFTSADGSWIGLKASVGKELKWTDGEQLVSDTAQFEFDREERVKEIHNTFSTGACATVDRRGTTGNWNLEPCTTKRAFVCEFLANTRAATTGCLSTFSSRDPNHTPVNDVICSDASEDCTEAQGEEIKQVDPICKEGNSSFTEKDRICCGGRADAGVGPIEGLPKWAIALIAVAAFAILAVIGFFVWKKFKFKDPVDEPSESIQPEETTSEEPGPPVTFTNPLF